MSEAGFLEDNILILNMQHVFSKTVSHLHLMLNNSYEYSLIVDIRQKIARKHIKPECKNMIKNKLIDWLSLKH